MSEFSSPTSSELNLEQQRKLARELLEASEANDANATARLRQHRRDAKKFKLADAQHVIATEAGFKTWPDLVHGLEQRELHAAFAALQAGDVESLRKWLSISPSVRRHINAPFGPFGARPINLAAENRAMLDLLIDHGADINLKSDWSKGPYGVMDSAPEDVARHLITRGAKLTACGAARLGWINELRAMLDTDPAAVHERGGDGQTPLHYAKTTAIVDLLLERGAHLDAKCIDHHSTAAQYALIDRPDVARHLIARGATPDIFMAARLNDLALAEKLIRENPDCVAARTHTPGYAPVHSFGTYGWSIGFYVSPHELALRYGHREMFDLLTKHSPPRVRLLDALMRADESAARAAIAEDPSLPASLNDQEKALFARAAFASKTDAAMLMLTLGFDPTARGEEGGTVLHSACWVGSARLVQALVERGVDVNLRDPTHGSPPVGWAALGSVMRCAEDGDYIAVIETLARAGAELNIPGNNRGKTLVEMANGNAAVQATLRRLGAS